MTAFKVEYINYHSLVESIIRPSPIIQPAYTTKKINSRGLRIRTSLVITLHT